MPNKYECVAGIEPDFQRSLTQVLVDLNNRKGEYEIINFFSMPIAVKHPTLVNQLQPAYATVALIKVLPDRYEDEVMPGMSAIKGKA